MHKVQHYRFEDLPRESFLDGAFQRTAFRGDGSLVTVNWMEPSIPAQPPHEHDFDQVSMVLEGEMLFTVDGEDFTVKAGEVIIIGAGVPHTAIVTGTKTALNMDVFAPSRDDYLYLTEYQNADGGELSHQELSPSDQRAVERLLVDWATALDSGDPRSLVGSVTDDIVISGVGPKLQGINSVREWAERRHANADRRTMHHLSNFRFERDETGTFRGTTYLLLYVLDSADATPRLDFQGWYSDVIVPDGSTLKFRARAVSPFV